MNDINQEMYYEWSDGTEVTYTYWNYYEPNNSGNEDCVEIYIDVSISSNRSLSSVLSHTDGKILQYVFSTTIWVEVVLLFCSCCLDHLLFIVSLLIEASLHLLCKTQTLYFAVKLDCVRNNM